jgi:shikimate kinase
MNSQKIFLTGFMGTGKSTVGKVLARLLEKDFIDSDDLIEERYGGEIRSIFAEKGEPWFREYEENIIAEICNGTGNAVISLGGGALISEKTQQLVRATGILFYLKTSPEEVWQRTRHSTRRPLLRPDGEAWSREDYLNRIAELIKVRQPGFDRAHYIIERDGVEAAQVAEDIRRIIQNDIPGRKKNE